MEITDGAVQSQFAAKKRTRTQMEKISSESPVRGSSLPADEEEEKVPGDSFLLVQPGQFSNKFRSKHELTYILEYELGYFLPAPKFRTISFLRDVLAGEKKLLPSSIVSSEKIPHFDELKIENIWPQYQEDSNFVRYLPVKDNYPICDREYFWKILSTLHTETVRGLVKQCMAARGTEDHKTEEQMVKVDKVILQQLNESSYLSKKKGRAIHLLKQGAQLDVKKGKKEMRDIEWAALQPDKKRKVSLDHILRGPVAPADLVILKSLRDSARGDKDPAMATPHSFPSRPSHLTKITEAEELNMGRFCDEPSKGIARYDEEHEEDIGDASFEV